MKWVLIAILGLAALVALVAIIGLMMPRTHVASRTLRVRRPAADVWALITDVGSFASWRSDVKSVDRLPDRDGRAAWIEHVSGGMDIPLETVEAGAPRRLVLRIAGPNLPFGGTWTYVVAPSGQAGESTLTITGDGFVSNPVFRFMSRLVFGHHATIDTYLKNVAKKSGEEPAISGE